jgi:type I restriction enzyme S subunit
MAWPTAKLSEICIFDRGLTYTKSDEVNFDGTPVLRANNIDLAEARLDLSDIRYISTNVVVPNSKRTKQGGLLICTASGSKAHLGKIAYIDDAIGWAFGGFMGQITAKPSVDSRYLYYILISEAFRIHLEKRSDGVNINNLKFSDIGDFAVPLPSLTEQQRIAAILDEAFAGIAKATANAERNIDNARALFGFSLAALISASADNHASLSDVCDFQGGSQPPKSNFSYSPKAGYVRMLQIRDFKSDDKAVWIPASRRNKCCTETDVMIGRYGASVGQIHRGKAGAYNVALVKTIPIETMCLREYLYYYLRSPLFQIALARVAKRSAQDGFSKEDIASFSIPLPDVSRQRHIAAHLAELEEHSDRLVESSERRLVLCQDLKVSLLHKAFTGQLNNASPVAT